MNKKLKIPFIICMLVSVNLPLALIGCGGKTSIRSNADLSHELSNGSDSSERFSEIRIYETESNKWLSASELSLLQPLKILNTPSEMMEFSSIMVKGHTDNQDPALRNFHYLPICYHIIAMNLNGTAYGYLKIQISSDTDKPLIARVECADGTNSFEYMMLLPAFLKRISR